jgi:hypothetical protein
MLIGCMDIAHAGRILDLPDDIACLYLMPVGHPGAEPDEESKKALNEILFFDK